jgi:hypothetical protein
LRPQVLLFRDQEPSSLVCGSCDIGEGGMRRQSGVIFR